MTDEQLLVLLADDGLLLTSEGRKRVLAAMRRAYDLGNYEGGKYGWQPDVGGVATIESNSHRQR